MANIKYNTILDYLDAIAKSNSDAGLGDVDSANHGRFWVDDHGVRLSRDAFVNGPLPGIKCNGNSIPIADPDPAKCPFYQALVAGPGWCNKGQMPQGGPYITDPGYTVTLADGTLLTGTDLQANITNWLQNGMVA